MGVNPDKIVPGASFYGVGWKVRDTDNNGLFQLGNVAKGISDLGFNDYKDLSSLMKKGYRYYWDNYAMAPWLFNPQDSTIWSFDDPVSVALKTRFVYAHNLRGLMFWEISGDDSIGTLVNTIYSGNMADNKLHKIHTGRKFPLIKLAIPSGSKNIIAGTDIILNINEIKINSPIVMVEYFADNVSLGYNTTPPFSWVWFNVSKGKHKIKAAATDIDGNRKLSKEITVNIKKHN